MKSRLLLVVPIVATAGCGSCSSGTSPIIVPTQQSARVTLTFPQLAAAGQRASRATIDSVKVLTLTVRSVNGSTSLPSGIAAATTVPLTTGSGGNCTNSDNGETCTATLPAPAGSVVYGFDVRNSANALIDTASSTFSIQSGVSNQSFAAQLQGVVNTVTVIGPTLGTHTSFSGPVSVLAFNASNEQYTGSTPYSQPFTLTDTQATGATSFTANGITARTVTVNTPSDVVILNYDGSAIPSFPVTAQGGTVPPGGGNPAGPGGAAGFITVTQRQLD